MAPLFKRVWYGLVVTADQTVLTSAWSQRGIWSLQLLEQHYFRTSEGGKRFFHLVEEVMSDSSDAAAELAEVLFTCLALGFQGELLGERKALENHRRLMYQRAHLPRPTAPGERLTPAAYGHNVARRPVRLPTAMTLRLLLIGLVQRHGAQ